MPGSLSPITNNVRNANSTWLNGSDLPGDLEQASGLKVRVANDANCFALSEASDGAAAGAPVVFGVILGTGVGGGLVVGGDIVEGRNRIGGEWGHIPLPSPNDDERPGPACFCGRHGCIETFLSGPGMTRDHARHTGEAVDADMIVRSAQEGHGGALSTLDRYERRLAKSLAGIINIVDPDVIVLGGGLSNLTRLYRNVPQLWPDQVFSDSVDTRLVPARHGDSSGVRGAAWLWPEGRNGP